jgi:hypothetical protein
MFVALVAIVMLPDFPHNTFRGFTAEERQLAQLRMLEDVRCASSHQIAARTDDRPEKSISTRGRISGTRGSDREFGDIAHWRRDRSSVVNEQDWKIYILMLSLTACVTGLSFNMCVSNVLFLPGRIPDVQILPDFGISNTSHGVYLRLLPD